MNFCDLENTCSPTSKKTVQVARVPTGRSRVYQRDKNSSTSPRELGQHMPVRSESQNVSAAQGWAGSHTPGRGAQRDADPWQETASSWNSGHTEKSPRGQSKAQAGQGLASHTSVVLPAGQRNQIHRVSDGWSSLLIIKELANQSR